MRRLSLLALLSAPALADPLGAAFTFQGELKEGGAPANAAYDFQVCLFDSADADVVPVPLACAPVFDGTPVTDGRFTLQLDFGSAAFNGEQRFLEIRVRPDAGVPTFTSLLPRQPIRPTPEATRAATAPWTGVSGVPTGFADGVDDVGSGTVTSVTAGAGLTGGTITTSGTMTVDTSVVQARVTGACTVGQYVTAIGADGSATCATDANSGGDITGVTAGAGLAGGAANGNATLSVDTGVIQARVTGTCGVGQYITAVAANGAVTCGADADSGGDITAVMAGSGMSGGGSSGAVSVSIDPTEVQVRVSEDCALGQSITAINQDGTVECAELSSPPKASELLIPTPNSASAGIDSANGPFGYPRIVSFEGTQEFRLIRCLDPGCSLFPESRRFTTTFSGNASPVLHVTPDDRPLVGHGAGDSGTGTNRVFALVCSDDSCTSPVERAISALNGSNQMSFQPHGMVVDSNGLPSFAYADTTANLLHFRRCATTDCSSLDAQQTIAGLTGRLAAIALRPNGLAVIASTNLGLDRLELTMCGDVECASYQTRTFVTSGRSPVIVVPANDIPIVVSKSATEERLLIHRCSDSECTSISTQDLLQDFPYSFVLSNRIDIELADSGNPVVTFGGGGGTPSFYVSCADVACSGSQVTYLPLHYLPGMQGVSMHLGADDYPFFGFFGNGVAGYSLGTLKCFNQTCQ